MDSKEVNKKIRTIIRPLLKETGFSKFTPRSAWRYHSDRIDVLNFQSFNSYNADILNVTTFSFAVNLGCYLIDIPEQYPIKEKDGILLPEESQCHFRGRLQRDIYQLENEHSDIWFIDEEGKYLDTALDDVVAQIKNIALPWYDLLSSREAILNILCTKDEVMSNLWGFGKNPSPNRSYLTGYVAYGLGREKLAREKLTEAVESGCFSGVFKSVEDAIQKAL